MIYRAGLAAALTLLGLLAASPWPAHGDPIGSGALKIQGNRLTLYVDEQANDADQTVNVGERARVRTCFGAAAAACGSVLPGDPRIAGMLVRAELRGPEVPQGIPLETVPGGTFLLPGFQQEGDYRLENIRLVDAATGQVLAKSEPSLAILHVREILLASASVRTLSLEELRARGITLTAENFQAFNFAVGFAFGDEIVEIELPLLYSGYGTVDALDKPTVNLDGLPPDVAHAVKRWQPPNIVPFKLEAPEEQSLRAEEEEDEALRLPLFGAIVIPGTVSYLNQFFEAKVIVANGAPRGSSANLDDIQVSLRLPPYNVLRIAASQPSVAPGQSVPVMSASGSRVLFPGEQGSAAWTIEGLSAGTHTLQMDVSANLERPGRDPFPLLSRLQAAVEVVDARFNLTFSHPDVVREGEEYTLFVTVTNLSRAAQNLITVDLDEAHMTGAHRADPADNLKRTIQTLAPGQAETLEYRLVAELDGKVVATTFQSNSPAGQGTIRLRTGVGELGIPLSPATLVLPRFSERLKRPFLPDDELHRAHLRFLGLAYSLAVAPAAMTPPGLPRVIKSDVERRAIDFGQAGMRTYLQEELLESLEVLALDYLGNRHPIEEIDELRRGTGKGLAVTTELAKVIRAQQAQRGFDAEELFDHFAETTTYTDPYVAAMLVPDAGDALELEVQGLGGTLGGAAGEPGSTRALTFGDLFPVRRLAGSEETVPFALVGHVTLGQELMVVVRNPGSSEARGTLLLIVPDAGGTEDVRYEIAGLEVPPGGAVAVRIGSAIDDPRPVHLDTNAPAAGFVTAGEVRRPPFRLIGAVQDFRLKEEGPDYFGNMIRPNRYGNGLLYLFNRPPAKEGAEDPESYAIRSTFQGQDTAGQPASGVSDKVGTGAWIQDDGRTVSVRYATPVSALIDPATGQPLLTHQHLLDTSALRDAWGEPLSGNVPPPTVESQPDFHLGGLVGGRVVRGTGEPVAGAVVQLIRPIKWETMIDTVIKLDYLGEVVTGADGTYFFDFVEIPSWDRQVEPSFLLRATIPAGDDPELEPEEVQEVGSTIRLQNRMARINIALLGRGTLTGQAVYSDDFSPVTQGRVRAASTLFNEDKYVALKADGTFTVPGMPVGPITLVVEDKDGRVGYATVGIDRAGALVEALVEVPRIIPGKGTVAGRVIGATTGDVIAGARVAVYSKGAQLDSQETDDFGRFRFDNVPEGQVSLQAANWAVSRVAVFTDLTLAAGETREIDLRLPQGESRVVQGAVYFHDPVTNTNVPVQGAVAFIPGPGVFAYTDAFGRYRIEGVPVQGQGESYQVKAIDFNRKLEGAVGLPPILEVSPDVIDAQSIVLTQMDGGIDGVVLDPLGRPLAGAEVVLYPYGTTTSGPNGGFSFAKVPLGGHTVVAHMGDGLQPGRVGYFGDAGTSILYGGHRPFVQVRMRGAGVVNILTRTQSATGILTPIYYKPTWYSSVEYRIRVKGAYIETSTDPNGNLQIVLPVGQYEIIAYNPFHGMKTIHGEVQYAGQIVDHEVIFENAATVSGQVVNVDGVTPVPDVEVVMEASGLKGQKQRTDPQGRFRFELVPMGRVMVTAQGLAGSVERVGRTLGYVGTAGQELELTVQMKAQGTVTGRIVDVFNGAERPLANAHYYLMEDTFPFRRIPEEGWRVSDAQGRYQVPHVYAGGVTVVARDSGQVSRQGSSRGTITGDWQVLEMPVIAMVTNVGSLQVTVRDPVSGGPVADAQVRLSNGDMTVTGPDGIAFFDALPLGSYTVYAFYAPSGQSGRLTSVALTSAGQKIFRTVYLDQRGEVRGTLWDDAAKTTPMPGGIVRLTGETAGGRVTALATTSSQADKLGKFEFLGIPEGDFQLEAAAPTSPRRAFASAALTATSPIVVIDMVLEPAGDLYFRLYEKLKAGTTAINLSGGLFSLRLKQQGYDYAQLAPDGGTDKFKFPGVLLSRSGNLGAEELTGERRTGGASFSNFTSPAPIGGAGTSADPYRVVLSPKGTVRVWVRDGTGNPAAGANVTLYTSNGQFPSVTGADGSVSFAAVPSGGLSATATSLSTGTGGSASATLTYDDELVEINIGLAPAVSARGLIYQPVPNDIWNGDPSQLVPAPGIIVQIRDSKGKTQLVLTDEQGSYRFGALPTGGFTLTARSSNGDQLASRGGTLSGPDGNENAIPALILDAAPPRLLTIAPPPGFEGVSRSAAVELVFSEPLDPAVLPVNHNNPAPYFSLRSASGNWAEGSWSSSVDAEGRQVVRFTLYANKLYENSTIYSLNVAGGSGGVRDRMLRPLTASGNVGSNFKTADGVGPAVIRSEPDLARPVDPAAPIRFDFSEAVQANEEQLDGDLSGDAVELYWQQDTGSATEWRRLPVATYLTRSNFSLAMQAIQGVSLQGDTLQRKVVIVGLEDSYGNVMPRYERTFRIYDDRAPRLDSVPFPPGGENGELLQGQKYTITPLLSALDDVTAANPGGDIDRVDYYFEDPTDPQRPVSPSYSSKKHPFAYNFVGAYSGNGVDPRPFPVWVRAVDTSTNQSNVVQLDMIVLPNTKPSVEVVSADASSPVPGTVYAGSKLVATASGFYDLDNSVLTTWTELWKEDAATPMASSPTRNVSRPTKGWYDAPAEAFEFTVPMSTPEGTMLFVRAYVRDSDGATGMVESGHFAVADDDQEPVIDDFSVRLAGAPVTHLFIGEDFYIELKARDVETAIQEITLQLDRTDIFPQALTATLVSGTKDLYRTGTLTVPPGFTDPVPVVASVKITDFGGNLRERTASFNVGPERDPTAPVARWITPWQGALWPADYTSTVSSQGAALLLRFYARDTNLDGDGQPIPGKLVTVEVRGPVRNANGELELDSAWIPAVKVAGTEDIAGAIYQAVWRVPNNIPAGTEVFFETRLIDSASTSTITRSTLTVVAARQVYELASTSVAADNAMLREGWNPDGPVFLLDGTLLSVLPQTNGSVRSLPALFLYAGGTTETGSLVVRPTVLTAPEITTYDSAILYHPLELAVAQEIGVSMESRIDMTRRGLLGNKLVGSTMRSMVLPGETGAAARAGGSHGGRGWFGSGTTQPGSVYDSLRDPRLPGGGGGTADTNAGGTGGGVIRLLAGDARVHLDGTIVTNGGDGAGTAGGGAGGAMRLAAGRLEGRGRIEARGGAGVGSGGNVGGAGGGGRVSITWRELAASFDLAAQVSASGGANNDRRGGAGTVYLEMVDAETGVAGPGRLLLQNPIDPARAALTPLPALGTGTVASVDPATAKVVLGVSSVRGNLVGDTLVLLAADGSELGRFPIAGQERVSGAVHLTLAATPEELSTAAGAISFRGESRLLLAEAEGSVRWYADDDLLLGPDGAAALNDRAAVILRRGARALLANEGPVVTFTTTPVPGSEAILGSSIKVEWSVADLFGLDQTKVESTTAPTPVVNNLTDEPLTAKSSAATTMNVPLTSAPSSFSFTVEARNQAGRVTRTPAVWPVPANQVPTGQVTLAAGTQTPVKAGYPFNVSVHAEDREKLSKVTLLVTGPATPAAQSAIVTGTSSDSPFTVQVSATADAGQPIVLQALIEDASGGSTTTAALSVPVAANGSPTGSVTFDAASADHLEPGRSVTVKVRAEDPDGIAKIDLNAAGSVTQPVQTQTVTGNPTVTDVTFTLTATADAVPGSSVSVTATVTDKLGGAGTTAELVIPVAANGAPTGSISLAAAAPDRIEPGRFTTVVVTAADPDGLARIDLHATGAVTQPEQTTMVTGTSASTTFTLTAAADATPQPVNVTATIVDTVGSSATTAPLTFQIVADVDQPTPTITLDPDRGATGVFHPGETVTVTASAVDDVAVTSLRLVVDGVTTASAGEPVSYVWTVPNVTSSTSFTFAAIAVDADANEGRVTRAVTAAPAPVDPLPVVVFTCPTNGAVLPGDYTVALSASASDDAGVTGVRFYLGDATTPFAQTMPTGTPKQTTATASFDLATATGATVRFRVEATDTAGQVSSQTIEVQRVTVVNLKADGQGTNNYASLTGQVVALRSGTLTLDSPVTFGGLLVLNGARIEHSASTAAATPKSLQVTVSGPVYVACGGSIDVSVRGYAKEVTYPGHQATVGNNGGSHMGEGGVRTNPPAETYGSVYFPRENGGGGFSEGRGGGAVRITADRVQVDGAIRANGQAECRGGAGGSVWIQTGALAGAGAIEAKGGGVVCGSSGAGGGGAIAVDYGTLQTGSTLLANLRAQGGDTGDTTGGAGTVYVKSGADAHGELIVDNGAVAGRPRTVLPSLGKGTAQAGSFGATLATGRSKAIPAYFTGHWVEVRSGATGTVEGIWRIASIAADGLTVTLEPNAGQAATVDPGDAWQGVYRLDRYTVRGNVRVDSVDPIRVAGEQVIAGTVQTSYINAGRLVVKNSASVTQHLTPSSTNPESLTIEVDELVVEAGGSIDVSVRGYAKEVTYPGHQVSVGNNGGSHMGEGGVRTNPPAETYGSVYFPRENGSGGYSEGRGGGVVRITADRAQVDGAIRANGQTECRGGAGGSVWIQTGSLAGKGTIEAKGGGVVCGNSGAGGGGAIAVDYGTLESGSTLLANLRAQGGDTGDTTGGAGTIFVKSGTEAHGELIVDNGTITGNRRTILPSLGKGTAQAGSSGATLATGRSKAIPTYFTGHWVEVRSGGTGAVEGIWRIASIAADGLTVTLEPNAGQPATVDPGDAWQGVYRFDRYTVRGSVRVDSADPIRVAGEQVIAGTVQTSYIKAGRLVVKNNASVTQLLTPSSTNPESLTVEVDELVVEAGGSIDVSVRGYAKDVTYPGHVAPVGNNGGSHLGEGGVQTNPPAETYGSVYFPRENGGGGFSEGRGGGAVRITADRVQVDGAIRANGQAECRGGAGGSVWIQTGALAGTGSIEAKGGGAVCGSSGAGGGGAIAVDYGTLESGATLLANLRAQGGTTGSTTGGAGTVYVKSGTGSYGELIVDNGADTGNRRTLLPSLGKGTAQPGSFGATLATGRSKVIPAYFTGHWVEVRSGAAGAVKGIWRIGSIAADGLTVTLVPNAGETVSVEPGDAWQGIYRFDRYTVRGQVQVLSPDPIRVVSEQVITGVVETDAIRAERLVIEPGGVLTQHLTSSASAPRSLTIEVAELVIKPGGAIDVSVRGYAKEVTYPGHQAPIGNNGGSHLGEGGIQTNPPAEIYGSVYFPRENGGGGFSEGRGGGAVRITADRVQLDGAIRANGQTECRGGAGGSVWIETDSLAGTGTIEAKGGNANCGSSGAGGGGAIAVDYGTLEPGATLLANLSAKGGGAGSTTGGAGTVYVKSGADAYGGLTVDNAGVTGNRRTILPALGSGTARSGSAGATLVTGRSKPIPAYFVGHWIEVRDAATGAVEGIWRVTSIGADGLTVTLASSSGESVTVDEGDAWQGVYLFDRYTIRGTLQVLSSDPIRVFADQVIAGTLETRAVRAGRLVIEPEAVLKQHLSPSSSAPESLTIEVGELLIRPGGSIDVSVRGYAKEVTYPGHQAPVGNNGGSHLGEGGIQTNPPAETYGSVYFPRENGGGGFSEGRGGGAVRITADRVQVDGAIRANGQTECRGGAGGSVWIQAGALAGTGAIEAKGGGVVCGSSGAGGGGAIAVDYGTLESGATLLANLSVQGGGTGSTTGGAGTVYVKSGADAHGELIVDNGAVTGNRRTILPSLGMGTAQPGSSGTTLKITRSRAIPAYFVGHWVEVRDGATGVVEGIWRVASIGADGFTATLAPNAGEPVTVDPGDAWQGIYRFDRYTVRGTLQVLSSDPIHVYSQQVITGNVQTDSIHAESLVIEPGAVLTQHLTPSSAAPSSLTIEVGELIVKAGGLIDVSARGYAKEVTYPGHQAVVGNNGGSHLGEGGVQTNPPAQTFGSVYFPRENGGGGWSEGRGGGAVKITAGLVRVDGVIRANGQTECRGGAGGSIWIQAQTLSGAGSIEAIGGNVACGSSGAGGGGAIAIEYAAVDPVSTLLDHLSAQGGTGTTNGGAGTIYLRGPGANLGSLRVDNKLVGGSRRTVLPPLGRGIVQDGSSGGTVLTGRDSSVPAYFVGSWVEIEGPDRFVKGLWRIASVSGTTITLVPKSGQPFNIIPGDRWRGVYRFDDIMVASTSILVSTDKLVQLVPPLPEESSTGPRSITSSSFEALYGNDEAPAWEKPAVSIEVGSVPGSYRIALAPGAVSDPDGISDVQLTSGGRSLTAAWTAQGASFLWSGRPGQQLHLVATDAHERFRRSAWLELPALPEGGWVPQLELARGVTPLAVTGGADWLALGAEGVWLYGTGAQPVSVVPPLTPGDEVVALAADGEVVYAAVRDRIDLLDRATETVQEMPVLGGTVVDVVADAGGATLLLADAELPVLRLARLQDAQLSVESGDLPTSSEPSLQRTPGSLHLFGLERSGRGVIHTWTGSTSGAPEVWEVPEGWRGVGAWERGALLLDVAGVRLVEHAADGWTEVSRIDLPAEPWSAAVAGSSLVVLLPGEVRVYDVTEAAAPVLAVTHPGSSYRGVEPLTDAEVLLWSPRMAAPPLRWNPAAALPGDGFTTVIDGLP